MYTHTSLNVCINSDSTWPYGETSSTETAGHCTTGLDPLTVVRQIIYQANITKICSPNINEKKIRQSLSRSFGQIGTII